MPPSYKWEQRFSRECGPEDQGKGGVSEVLDSWRECGTEVAPEAGAVAEEKVEEIVDDWRECGPEGAKGAASDVIDQWRDCNA